MLITVITPSRNQGKYIRDCLDSVHGQSHREIEHIVLDGMSTDDTSSVVKDYPSVFMQQKDTGPAQAINRGLELAKGDIVCWLNADDLFFCRDTLREVAELFERLPDVDVITGDGYFTSEDGKLLRPISPSRCSRMSAKWLQRWDSFLQPATFWRRNSIRLDETLHYTFDWRLWLDFYRAGLNVLYVPRCFARYRIQPESLSQKGAGSRKSEIYRMVSTFGESHLQALWCWVVWRVYVLAEFTHAPLLIRIVDLANAFLDIVTGGRIVST